MTDREAMEMALEALEWHEEQDEEIRYDECPSRAAMDDLRQALTQGEPEVSYTDIQMAELIMSDCGHSSDYKPLLDRIAGRLATYRQARAQPEQRENRMTDLRKAADMALYALENNLPLIEDYGCKEQLNIHHAAIVALYKTLAQSEPWDTSDIVSDGGFDPRNKFDAQPEQDRESDRKRFPDEAFNCWLDEGISDAGHTVWDMVGDIYSAWTAWDTRPFYDKTVEQEPVAWITDNYEQDRSATTYSADMANRWRDKGWRVAPLYTAPVSKPWVDLTQSGLLEIVNQCRWKRMSQIELARAIESASKELNNG